MGTGRITRAISPHGRCRRRRSVGKLDLQDQLVPLGDLDGDLDDPARPDPRWPASAVERGGTKSGHASERQPERLTSEIEAGPAELASQSDLARSLSRRPPERQVHRQPEPSVMTRLRAVPSLLGGGSGVPAREHALVGPKEQEARPGNRLPAMSSRSRGASRIMPALLWSRHPPLIIVRIFPNSPTCRLSFMDLVSRRSRRPRAGLACRRRLPFPGDSLSNLPASRVRGNSRRNVRTEWQDRGESIHA